MNEFGPELDRQADPMLAAREDAPAQAVARFQHTDGAGMLAELGGGYQAGSAGTHDQGIEHFSVGHAYELWHTTRPRIPPPGRLCLSSSRSRFPSASPAQHA